VRSHGNPVSLPRVMLCINGLCRLAVSVSPSVRLSVRHVRRLCRNKKKHIFKIFSPSGSHTVLVFSVPNVMAIFWRERHEGGSNAGGVGKKSRFSANIWLSDRWLLKCEQQPRDGPPCSLPHRQPRISESCLSQPAAWITTTKRDNNAEFNSTHR